MNRKLARYAVLPLIALAACGGAAAADQPTTTTAAPTTTVAPTTAPKATAGDVRACEGASKALSTATATERSWLGTGTGFSMADYHDMATTLGEGLGAASEEADDATVARTLIDINTVVDDQAPSYTAPWPDFAAQANSQLAALNDRLPAAVQACSALDQTMTPGAFTPFAS